MPGDLSDTTPVDLCLQLAGQGATGTLTLSGPAGEATLVFADGRLTGGRQPGDTATHDEAGAVDDDRARLAAQERGIDTLLAVASWPEGAWDFRPATPDAPGGAGPGLPVDRVLVEVRRRAAERQQVADVVPSPVSVFVLAPDRPVVAPDDAAAARVLELVDGDRAVRDLAETLGTGVHEVARHLYRLVLQGRVVPADTMGTSPARSPSAIPDPATEDAALHASTTTGPAPVQLADDGWAAARADARTVADEPEPWVGWANGGTTPDEAAPASRTSAPPGGASLWDHAARPSAPAPSASNGAVATPPTAAPRVDGDGDTRRQLFSELHDVGRSQPGAGAPAPAPRTPEADPTASAPAEPAPPAEPTVPAPEPPAAAPLSRSDVSDLLAELHALNLDD